MRGVLKAYTFDRVGLHYTGTLSVVAINAFGAESGPWILRMDSRVEGLIVEPAREPGCVKARARASFRRMIRKSERNIG